MGVRIPLGAQHSSMDNPLASGPVLKMGVRIPLGALVYFKNANFIEVGRFKKVRGTAIGTANGFFAFYALHRSPEPRF
jgi:hypothetical protein